MSKVKTCELEGCGNEFTLKPRNPHQKFCSNVCRAKDHGKKKTALLSKFREQNDDDNVVKRSAIGAGITANTDVLTKTILDFKEKELDRMESAYNDERSKRKKLKEENEKLRDELAEIKTNNRIREIEETKPSGLSGLFPGGIEGIMNNPHVGPILGALLGKILAPAGDVLGGGNASAANGFIEWFEGQSDEVKTNFAELVDGLSKADPTSLADTIKRMVNVLTVGSTINNPAEFKQTASYGY